MSERIQWIDMAKGIGILLMVLGHTGISAIFHNWIYSFHMPLFIIISGVFFNTKKSHNEILKSRVKTLLLPYFFFMILLYVSTFVIHSEYWQTPDFLNYFMNGSGTAIWFLPVLFFCNVLYGYLCKYKELKILIAGISLAVGYLLYMYNVHLPYKIECTFYFLFFLILGSYFRRQILNLPHRINRFWMLTLSGCCFIISSTLAQISKPVLGMAYNNCGNWYLTIPLALVGTFFVLLICAYFENRLFCHIEKFLLWCGNNTITILGFSQFYYVLTKSLTDNIPIDANYLYPFRIILIFIACYLTSIVMNKYLPIFVGK